MTKIFSRLRRVAPIVRRIAMSRVLARTSMIRLDRMLNTATSTMIDRMTNIATRSISSASNRDELMLFQSFTTARPSNRCVTGASVSVTVSGSSVVTSIMPIASPVSSKVCASAMGMTTKALS